MFDRDRLIFFNMGLGQDSTAIAVMWVERKLPERYYRFKPYFVFADTGAEWPQTYLYRDNVLAPYLRRHGMELHVLAPHGPYHQTATGRSYPDIWTAFMTLGKHPTFPTLTSPRCTMNSKQYPLARFRSAMRHNWCGRTAHQQARNGTPDIVVIGIAADEQDRAMTSTAKNYVCWYPLIELGLDRSACQKVIREAGLPVPPKSGCWLCPFQPVWAYWLLAEKHPHLFAKAEAMENACIADRAARGLLPNYILHSTGLPLHRAVTAWRRQNPRVTVEEVERWLYDRAAYAVRFGRKRCVIDERQLTFAI